MVMTIMIMMIIIIIIIIIIEKLSSMLLCQPHETQMRYVGKMQCICSVACQPHLRARYGRSGPYMPRPGGTVRA